MSKTIKRSLHERNIFRNPPDYTELAIKYRDFRHVCTLELSGRASVDYKNENALKNLTQTLLQEYFGLNIEFAPQSLIPTLPCRLNYILWLEDLLIEMPKNEQVNGIDIGCGSSCIYSVLGAKKNGWHMLALESNEINLRYAQENIKRNHLEDFISIFKQSNKNIIFQQLFKSLADEKIFQFCVCNPPFYDSKQTNTFEAKTRNLQKRNPPNNCHTGLDEELACEGGEVKFVQSIITESLQYQTKVFVFTTMLGHKSSLSSIKETLNEKNIKNYCSTEFFQGRTTRWGIAWSFYNDVDLQKLQKI